MEIIEGFIAVTIPYIVSICPHKEGWGVIVYGGEEADTVTGIALKHFAQTIPEAKTWASDEIGRRFQKHFALDAPELVWENLVCGGPPRTV
jgi:hypothetical protein